MAGGYAGIGYLAVSGRLQTALIGAVLLLLFMAAGLFLYWRRFEYRVGENEIRIDSGILNRTHRSIPFDRIQDVDITQGPVARLFGLARVKFETGGSAGEEEGVLQAILLERAEELRKLVRSRRGRLQRSRRTRHGGGPGRHATHLCDGSEAAAARGHVQLLAGGVRGPVRPDADVRRCAGLRPVQPQLLAEPAQRRRPDPRFHPRAPGRDGGRRGCRCSS